MFESRLYKKKLSSIDRCVLFGVVIYFLINISIFLYQLLCQEAIIPNGPEVQTIISKLYSISDISTFIFFIAFLLPELISFGISMMKRIIRQG